MNNSANHQSHLMKHQLIVNADGRAACEQQQSRCYLCDIPKQEYSLTRSFSELICRGCLNYEGPDRVEQLIAEARQVKNRQASPLLGAAAGVVYHQTNDAHRVGNNEPAFKTRTTTNVDHTELNDTNNEAAAQSFCYHGPPRANKQANSLMDTAHNTISVDVNSVDKRQTIYDGCNPNKITDERSVQKQRTNSLARSTSPLVVWDCQVKQHDIQHRKPDSLNFVELVATRLGRNDATQNKTSRSKSSGNELTPALDPQLQSNNAAIAECCKPAAELYSPPEPGAQIHLNHEVSSRAFMYEQPSRSSLLEQQQHQMPTSKPLNHSATTAANSSNHNKQNDNYTVSAKQSITPTSILSPSESMNYTLQQHHYHHHHQQQQLFATTVPLDPYQMIRTPARSRCKSVDQLLGVQQQHFHSLKDAASFERKLAHLHGGVYLVDADGEQKDGLSDCNKSAEVLQRLINDPNTGQSLSMYASSPNVSGESPPPHLSRAMQQPSRQAPSAGPSNGTNKSTGKQAAAAATAASSHTVAAAQAMSSSLYGNYPIAMGPYMTPNSSLFCASQYHPYHYHNQATAFQSLAYNSILGSYGPLPQQQAANITNAMSSVPDKSFHLSSGGPTRESQAREFRYLLANSTDQKPTHSPPPMDPSEMRYAKQPLPDSINGSDKPGCEITRMKSPDACTINNNNNGKSNREMNNNGRDDKSKRNESANNNRGQDELTVDNNNSAKQRASPPPAKRPTLEFLKTKILAKNDAAIDGLKRPENSNSSNASTYLDCLDAPAKFSSPSLVTKPKGLAIIKQHTTRRSQEARNECTEIEVEDTPEESGSTPDVDGLRHTHRSGNKKNTINANSPKNSHVKALGSHNQRPILESFKSRNGNAQIPSKSTMLYQGDSSDRGYNRAPGVQPIVNISSTTSSCGRKPNSTSQQMKQQQQQQQEQQLVPPHQYTLLRCLNCRDRLEDRHFVQCPSVVAHKFCFACSKASIERQQLENKNLGNGFDRVFCPSGNRCYLANEHTSWTFMNSEIETIFRESSGQPSPVSPSEVNTLGAHANSNSSSQMGNEHQQNGHHDKGAPKDDVVKACDKLQRNSSSSGNAGPMQKKYDDSDGGSPGVGSSVAQNADKVT